MKEKQTACPLEVQKGDTHVISKKNPTWFNMKDDFISSEDCFEEQYADGLRHSSTILTHNKAVQYMLYTALT